MLDCNGYDALHTAVLSEAGVVVQAASGFLDAAEEVSPLIALLDTKAECTFGLTLSGSSYGAGACAALGVALQRCGELRYALFDDIFTRRQDAELQPSLALLLGGLQASSRLTFLDLSNNALSIAGAGTLG